MFKDKYFLALGILNTGCFCINLYKDKIGLAVLNLIAVALCTLASF